MRRTRRFFWNGVGSLVMAVLGLVMWLVAGGLQLIPVIAPYVGQFLGWWWRRAGQQISREVNWLARVLGLNLPRPWQKVMAAMVYCAIIGSLALLILGHPWYWWEAVGLSFLGLSVINPAEALPEPEEGLLLGEVLDD